MSNQNQQICSHFESLGYTDVHAFSTDSRKFNQIRAKMNGAWVIIPIKEAKKSANIVPAKRTARDTYISADMAMLAMLNGLQIR